ncbi:uncharacterized protein Triagg1_6940 [Trichoderma aggressivum f. europaeum]|uniref:Nephrocystin 3-like N-terminal domain-containing protein n=1 Tax=Trichoderma aggressivum f. europaeum TaxID=173218 RepID=A0AAE1M3A0_9HYPO|nr:hypothetical protein Triagg1_6940 [Trichoderma aggressivum f. europaeum]
MSDHSRSSETSSVQEEEFQGPRWREDIDIVVIHGDEDGKKCSPDLENAKPLQDSLFDRIGEIREKIIFEYDVGATFGAGKTAGFDEAAVNLLETICKSDNKNENANGAGGSRNNSLVPLVMIAHGLGGRIVQRALCMARRSLKYRSIELRTELLMFVGTPQVSSKYDELMGDLLWSDVRREFLSFALRYRIISINQDLEIGSSRDIFFLDCPTEKRLTRNTQYMDLGQFSLEDEDLMVLTRETESLLKPSHFDDYYDEYLAVLQFMNKKRSLKIYQDEPTAQSRSFKWMEQERPKIERWLSESASRILLVSGDEGLGMRPESQHLMEEAEERYKESAMSTVSASFTFDSFDDRFNTLEALFTSLVLQLLLADPTLFSLLADVEAGSVADMLSDDTNEPMVSRLWRLMKTLLLYRRRCAIVCGINAIQDCKSDYTAFLEDLKNLCSISEANFKIVITSVYDGTTLKIPLSIALDQEEAMKLQRDEVMKSVSIFISTRHDLKELERYIASTIFETIGTNFWQANLHLKYLEMSMTHTTPKSIRDTMTSLGAGPAQSIISRFLHRLIDHGKDRSLRMLAWITYGFRPLELPELATAMALDFVDPVSSAQKPVSLDCDPIDDWYSRDISVDIQLTLRNILEIRGTAVSIANLHLRKAVIEEVRKRANRSDLSYKMEGEKFEAAGLSRNIDHLTIAQICLGYLSVERMERVYELLDGQHLLHSGPYQDNFCIYAAQYWPAHYRSIEGPAAEVITAIMERLQCPPWLAAWRKLNDHLGYLEHKIPEIPDFQAPISFYCASLGLRAALEVALEKEVQMIDDESKDIILMAATRSGDLKTVKYLLARFDYQHDSISEAIAGLLMSGNQAVITELLKRFQWEQESPAITSLLEQAAYMNGPPLLMQTAADQLKQHQSGSTAHLQPALHAAVKVGNKAAAEIILDLKFLATKATRTATDEESQTRDPASNLLHLAVANGNVNLLSMLASENLPIDMVDEKNRTSLHLASMLSYQSMVRHLILRKIDVNAKDALGRTALHYAALMGHLEIVKELLLQEDIAIDEMDAAGDTPLLLATKMQQGEVVEELLEKKASHKKYNKFGDTALHIAVRNADKSIVQLLTAEEDVDLEAKTVDSLTPLLLAAECGHLDIFKHLLNSGAGKHAENAAGLTPLHLAAKNGHVALAEFLIQIGAEIDCLGNATSPPFHLAAEAGHVAFVKMLLQHNANIQRRNRLGQTPIMIACEAGNVETVRCLVNNGAGPEEALSVAAAQGYRQIVEILLKALESDDELKWKRDFLNKALREAIEKNHLSIAKRIFETGVDIESKDFLGNSLLDQAMRSGSVDMVRLVLERGADVNHISIYGHSALHLAIKYQLDECVKLLVGAGADVNVSKHWVMPPLHFAASYGTLASFTMLLDATEDIEFRSKVNNTTCMYAACNVGRNTRILGSEDTVERIKLLEAKGANIKALGGKWGSPLHAAIAMRSRYTDAQSLDVMEYLLLRGASVTDKDEQGRSAVHIAASTKGSLDSFIKILGRDPNGLTRQDTQGRTVWHHATAAGNLRVLKYISRLICSDDCENEESSQIPKDPRIKDAISQGDKHGWTPLMWSGKQQKHQIVSFLVHHGADAKHISRLDWNADHVALYHGQRNVKRRLNKMKSKADRTAKAEERLRELQRHNPGAEADEEEEDDDSELTSDSDAYDGSKKPIRPVEGAGTVLIDGKPVGEATRRRLLCGGCATTFKLNDEDCKEGEMPPAPGTDSAQVDCAVPLPVTDDVDKPYMDLMFSS